MPSQKLFTSPTYGTVTLKDIAGIIKNIILEHPDAEFSVAIGSDSHTTTDSKIVQAVTVHRIGNGGIFFYRSHKQPKFRTLQEKLITETQNSIETASELLTEFDTLFDREGFSYVDYNLHFQVHCDVGTGGSSAGFINEVTGYVRSVMQNNCEIFIKPDSYAASFVADKISKPVTKFKG